MKALFWIVAVPLALAAALFAVANRETVAIELWPFAGRVDLPLFAALAVAFYAGFLLGALVAWLSGGKTRSRARAASRRAQALERDRKSTRLNSSH